MPGNSYAFHGGMWKNDAQPPVSVTESSVEESTVQSTTPQSDIPEKVENVNAISMDRGSIETKTEKYQRVAFPMQVKT